jgi:pancreatic lipase-related protein 2
MGAQIQARASRLVQSRTNRRHVIARLTGLDPWNMGPISSLQVGVLSSTDAQWVESIHTEGNQRGDHESTGHVAFFVNGGVEQPHCTQSLPGARWDCSHYFALSVWAESVRARSTVFASLSCGSWTEFLASLCNSNAQAFMGRIGSQPTARGPFFLLTNMQPPWSRNQAHP